MRWVYLLVIVLIAAVLFAIENLQLTTMSFLGFSLRAPLAVRGAFTGGSLFALLRATIQAIQASWPATSQT